MPALINAVLGLVLTLSGLALFYGSYRAQKAAAWARERLRAVLGEGLEVHDWVFALLLVIIGCVCLTSAVMWIGRSQFFWVLSYG